jgi:hypothetical protein
MVEIPNYKSPLHYFLLQDQLSDPPTINDGVEVYGADITW